MGSRLDRWVDKQGLCTLGDSTVSNLFIRDLDRRDDDVRGTSEEDASNRLMDELLSPHKAHEKNASSPSASASQLDPKAQIPRERWKPLPGEEMTTQSEGEEGGMRKRILEDLIDPKYRLPRDWGKPRPGEEMTTQEVGEEGGSPKPRLKDLIEPNTEPNPKLDMPRHWRDLDRNMPEMTTMAVGEEGGSRKPRIHEDMIEKKPSISNTIGEILKDALKNGERPPKHAPGIFYERIEHTTMAIGEEGGSSKRSLEEYLKRAIDERPKKN